MKMLMHNAVLPVVYSFWVWAYRNKSPNLIIFADSHSDILPYSMERIHEELLSRGYKLTDEIYDFSTMSALKTAYMSMRFMRFYAQARYVFICNNFLPVSACRKRKETTVIQLTHFCGLFKKMGYDTTEDIPAGYKGEVYKNYDLVTVSAEACVKPLEKAMHLPQGIVKALGVSRTDNYYDPSWLEACKTEFYQLYPQAHEKKIILWAPTFRGNDGKPYQVGTEEINQLERELGGDYILLKKVHPHVDKKYHLSNCSIPTERLLPVVDVLVSDYSSVVNEFMFFDKPYVLFAPDLEKYIKVRGFYVEYESFSPYVAVNNEELEKCINDALSETQHPWVQKLREYHLSACDGKVTVRILNMLELDRENEKEKKR